MKIKVKILQDFHHFKKGDFVNVPLTTAKDLVAGGYGEIEKEPMPKAPVKKVTRSKK